MPSSPTALRTGRQPSGCRHFVSLFDLSPAEAGDLLDRTLRLKRGELDGRRTSLLQGRTLGLVFEKPSLRTRVSFEAAMAQLGGNSIFLRGKDVGLGVRESVADFARVISQYVDALAVRTFSHATVEELARHATIPVINALSDSSHPCQAMADLVTIQEQCGSLARTEARLRRRRQQRGPVAGPGLGPAGPGVRPDRAGGLRVPGRLSPTGSRHGFPRSPLARRTRPAQGRQGGRRRLHRRLGQHGPGARGRPAARGLRARTR